MANYGLTYQGSKDKLVHKIASVFPTAQNFYDLFGGGFSMTHYMIQHHSKKYKYFHFNEIQSDLVQLLKDAIAGKYNYNVFKPEWIDRETFNRDKDKCAYTRIIWSFGNNMKDFMFGKEIEPLKRSLHQAVVFDEFDDKAKELIGLSEWPKTLSIRGKRLLCREMLRKRGRIHLQRLQQLQQLERLQRLEQLERLERLQRLNFTALSYDKVLIKPNSVIYCDPPYKNTAGYLGSFDHDKFWEWVRSQTNPVFVSEYTAPKDIKVVMALNHKKSNSANTRTDSVEKLYGNQAAVNVLKNGIK